jgi:hypothetical protein
MTTASVKPEHKPASENVYTQKGMLVTSYPTIGMLRWLFVNNDLYCSNVKNCKMCVHVEHVTHFCRPFWRFGEYWRQNAFVESRQTIRLGDSAKAVDQACVPCWIRRILYLKSCFDQVQRMHDAHLDQP